MFNKISKPNLPAGDRYFTQPAFLPLLDAQSDDVRLCTKTVVKEANHDYGIPERFAMTCRKLNAYILPKDMSVLMAEGGVTKDTLFTIVIVAASSEDPQFSSDEVKHNSYFYVDNADGRINGRFMQGVLTRVVTDHTYPAAWFYDLKETSETLDIPLEFEEMEPPKLPPILEPEVKILHGINFSLL